jgi:hypothetical protein
MHQGQVLDIAVHDQVGILFRPDPHDRLSVLAKRALD